MLDRPTAFPAMKRLGAFDLKWVLVRRILFATILCALVGAAIVLSSVASEAKQKNAEIAKTIGDVLRLQLVRIDSALDLPQRFPDWNAVLDFTLQPGQCVIFSSVTGNPHSRCVGVASNAPAAPAWFVQIYDTLFLTNIDTPTRIDHRTDHRGTLEVTANRPGIAYQAWSSVSDMLRLSLALIVIMCFLVYVAIDRALRPTSDILSGLDRLASGSLAIQLPQYRLRELDQISGAFNRLANELRVTIGERAEFARRLLNTQEHDRRHIARELHDDVAQQLTALSGLAASIQSSLNDKEPVSKFEVDELVKLTGTALDSLRTTLTYLRPQEIDDLGLSLDGT